MTMQNIALKIKCRFFPDRLFVALFLLSLCLYLPVEAADWGYEGEPEPYPRHGGNNLSSPSVRSGAGITPGALTGQNGQQDVSLRAKAGLITEKSVVGKSGTGETKITENAGRVSSPKVADKHSDTAKTGRQLAAASSPRPASSSVPLPPDPPLQTKTAEELRQELHKEAVDCWMQFLMGMSPSPLSDEHKSRFKKYLQTKLEKGGRAEQEVLALNKFWNKFVGALAGQPERADAYAQFFRSLLRLRARQDKTPVESGGYDLTCDREMINELLGPERLAESGDPPLAEDAINSYADMACFIYEKRHSGKTIDGQDNRALFASVIAQKYKNAPSQKDKLAMASFDLIWAKFKILYLGTNAQTQTIMVDSLMKDGAVKAASLSREPMLELILSSWPWQ